MTRWQKYQEETADFFRGLDCDATVNASVQGARALHMIDVWVVFRHFGLETKWVIECKFWKTAVPKEKVLVLKSLVEDVGADRGILISKKGFQSGAIHAASKSNITLTNLDELKESAAQDLLSSVLGTLERKATIAQYSLNQLYTHEQMGPGSWTAKPLHGVDGASVVRAMGKLATLKYGFDRARLREAPYPVSFDAASNLIAGTLEDFVRDASVVIDEVYQTLHSQHPRNE